MISKIKTILLLVFLLAVFVITAKYGLYVSTAFSFPAFIFWAFIHKYIEKWEYRELLKQYAVMIENIYEASEYPGDRNVRQRAQRHRELLQESGNPEKITVHELYFQDGEHCNESWEEFERRIEAFRMEDRRKHHKKISEESRDWYIDHALKQN